MRLPPRTLILSIGWLLMTMVLIGCKKEPPAPQHGPQEGAAEQQKAIDKELQGGTQNAPATR